MQIRGDDEARAVDVSATLARDHRRFLAFVRPRVRTEADAEEVLQAAFVKGIEAAASLRDEESVVAWFYRLLRNALVDHYRRRGAEARALEAFAMEMPTDFAAVSTEVRGAVCACVGDLLPSMPAEQAALLRSVDMEARPVADVAREDGIAPGTARVRLHRARRALRSKVEEVCGACAEHGCLECTCQRVAPGPEESP